MNETVNKSAALIEFNLMNVQRKMAPVLTALITNYRFFSPVKIELGKLFLEILCFFFYEWNRRIASSADF